MNRAHVIVTALALTLIATPAAYADDPIAAPAPAAPTKLDPTDPGLHLPVGA